MGKVGAVAAEVTRRIPQVLERDRSLVAADPNVDERAAFCPILIIEHAANGDRSRSVCDLIVWATRP